MDKQNLYKQLDYERERAFSEDTGYVMRKEAWERIDALLDCLSELNHLPVVVEAVSE